MKQGRIDAGVRGSETLPTLMKDDPNTYRILAPPFTVVRQGIAFPKTDTALRDAVLATAKQIFADGTYTKLIEKWQLQASAAPELTLNGAALP